ncbi:MAG: leucine--tRNA ligase [Candidatus Aenigmarchaeota archaeon ex4484_52]|nr:MAG: leucine--tRNA ligase [Candidatus Aenigmarchaeota archaeon ex4484_52]
MNVFFRDIEKKWQQKWKQSKIFEANPKNQKTKFFITSPYPYANGPYHIGHGRSYVCSDVFARIKRMQGFNVLYPMAFHITGTPVLAVSAAIKRKDKKIIELYKEYVSYHTKDKKEIDKIINSFTDPWNLVKYFSVAMRKDFENIGMSLDWRRCFTTGDKIYNKFIEWQYHHLKKQKLIIKDKYPVLYCVDCDNAVGEDDIKSGDEQNLDIQEFVLIKFKLQNQDAFIVVGTLRPETIFGATNIWINPNEIYVKAQVNNEIWFISKIASLKLIYQNKKIKIIKEINGSELISESVITPVIKKKIPILPADFADVDFATGIVFSVPAHSVFDFIALCDLKKNKKLIEKHNLDFEKINSIKPVKIIDTKNFKDIIPAEYICKKYNISNQSQKDDLKKATEELYSSEFYNGILNKKCLEFSNLKVNEIKNKIKDFLVEKNISQIFYRPVSWPLKCRCGGKIFVKILKDQWFIDFNSNKWKEKAKNCLEQMTIIPGKYRTAFEKVFEWLDKRPCARKRGLGTQLPFDKKWVIESLSDSTIYTAFYTIAGLIKKHNIEPEQLSIELFDYIYKNKGTIKEISKQAKIDEKIIQNMKNEFEYWYGVDLRHTAIMHISNHLSFYIFHHTAIFDEKYWPKAISLIEPVLCEGQKMGKSKGNVIALSTISSKYFADLFRIYIITNASFSSPVDWKEKEVKIMEKQLEKFYWTIENIISCKSKKIQNNENAFVFESRFNKILIRSIAAANQFNLQKYAQMGFYDISNLVYEYIANNKKNSVALHKCIKNWIILLSPLIPHIAEELWQKTGEKKFVSVCNLPKITSKDIDEELIEKYDFIEKIIKDINNIKKIINAKPKKINLYIAENWKYFAFNKSVEIEDKANLFSVLMSDARIKKHGKDAANYIKYLQKNPPLKKTDMSSEYEILKKEIDYISKCVGLEVCVLNSDDFEGNLKANRASPSKPGIELV